MSYRADKQVIDTHTHTDRYTDRGDDNTRRPKLASGKNVGPLVKNVTCIKLSNVDKSVVHIFAF